MTSFVCRLTLLSLLAGMTACTYTRPTPPLHPLVSVPGYSVAPGVADRVDEKVDRALSERRLF